MNSIKHICVFTSIEFLAQKNYNQNIKEREMSFKPITVKKYQQLIKLVKWTLKKGKIDWILRDNNGVLICSIKIAYGKNTKEEIVADSVRKTKKAFEERGLTWPPQKKS